MNLAPVLSCRRGAAFAQIPSANTLPFPLHRVFQGSASLFGLDWYDAVGASLTATMLSNILVPYIPQVPWQTVTVSALVAPCRLLCCGVCESQLYRPVPRATLGSQSVPALPYACMTDEYRCVLLCYDDALSGARVPLPSPCPSSCRGGQ